MKDPMKLDLYELFNLKISATQSEIKKAYRKKALTCHPDKNPDNPKAAEDFKLIHKAKEILTDGSTRAEYDKALRARKADVSKPVYMRKEEKASKKNAKEKACPKRSKQNKEETKKPCFHTNNPKKPNPFWFPSFARDKHENTHSRRRWTFSQDSKRPFPSWPPSFSKSKMNSDTFKQNANYNTDSPSRKAKKNTIPTWPPSASKTHTENDNSRQEYKNTFWTFTFTPIVKPATFVAPSSNMFDIFNIKNPGGFSQSFQPIIKPAKFVAPSNSKTSTGFHSTEKKSASPIKPATFVPPSKVPSFF